PLLRGDFPAARRPGAGGRVPRPYVHRPADPGTLRRHRAALPAVRSRLYAITFALAASLRPCARMPLIAAGGKPKRSRKRMAKREADSYPTFSAMPLKL